MYRSDAQGHSSKMNAAIDSLNDDVVFQIENELQDSPNDMISLVFLLYDTPDTALQKLIVFQRISKDSISTNLNLLHEWLRDAKSRKIEWKHELLEALLICQLYGIVQKLGFHLASVLKHYQPDNIETVMYVNPLKKALYKLCEDMDTETFIIFKRSLMAMKIDINQYENCELIFLKLMSEKVITYNQFSYNKKKLGFKFNAEKLIQIIEKLPNMQVSLRKLKELQSEFNNTAEDIPVASTVLMAERTSTPKSTRPFDVNEFKETMDMFTEIANVNFQSDNKANRRTNYAIKNPQRMGVCIIINQENFHLSEKSLQDSNLKSVLNRRDGSSIDKAVLDNTMSALHFDVITADNLGHVDMMRFIRDTIRGRVYDSDSVFMLCILSHGVRGHVYAADCVKVNVDDIQSLLDSDEAAILREMPKVLIIQACQVDDSPVITLVSDAPSSSYHLNKSDFIIYWATSPEYEAYRHEEKGSIFIQILCAIIQKNAKKEHLYDIFTLVNKGVINFCKLNRKYQQVPIFASTLQKKVYLQVPDDI